MFESFTCPTLFKQHGNMDSSRCFDGQVGEKRVPLEDPGDNHAAPILCLVQVHIKAAYGL